MHHIYTTPAFVVSSRPYGESGRFLTLFTRDFGMIGAIAQGVRLSKSKLRYHTQDYDFSHVSIVRGKEVWRLTGAYEIRHEGIKDIHLKVLKLLKRLLHGEDKNEKLFDIIEKLYQTNIEQSDYLDVEYLTVLRVLDSLGYIGKMEKLEIFLKDISITRDLTNLIKKERKDLIKIINSALSETHL